MPHREASGKKKKKTGGKSRAVGDIFKMKKAQTRTTGTN